MSAEELTAPLSIVICPSGCNSHKEMVWGSDTYAQKSSICASAIHAGKISSKGGSALVEKRPVQKSYVSTTRNGITSKRLEESEESFVFSTSRGFKTSTNSKRSHRISGDVQEFQPKTVVGSCTLTGKELPASTTKVYCPHGCKENLWGSDIYTEDSSVCAAAAHEGIVTPHNGEVIVQKKSGRESYAQSTRNGVTSKSQGPSAGSFVMSETSEYQKSRNKNIPKNALQEVEAICNYTAKQLPAKITLVICPPGCLGEKENVWGSATYTQESSVCAAGIHAGKITAEGGDMIVQKTPGQDSYESSTSNGITTKRWGSSSASFEFISKSSYEFQSTLYTESSYEESYSDTEEDSGEGFTRIMDSDEEYEWDSSLGEAEYESDSSSGEADVRWYINSAADLNSESPEDVQWYISSGADLKSQEAVMYWDENSSGQTGVTYWEESVEDTGVTYWVESVGDTAGMNSDENLGQTGVTYWVESVGDTAGMNSDENLGQTAGMNSDENSEKTVMYWDESVGNTAGMNSDENLGQTDGMNSDENLGHTAVMYWDKTSGDTDGMNLDESSGQTVEMYWDVTSEDTGFFPKWG